MRVRILVRPCSLWLLITTSTSSALILAATRITTRPSQSATQAGTGFAYGFWYHRFTMQKPSRGYPIWWINRGARNQQRRQGSSCNKPNSDVFKYSQQSCISRPLAAAASRPPEKRQAALRTSGYVSQSIILAATGITTRASRSATQAGSGFVYGFYYQRFAM